MELSLPFVTIGVCVRNCAYTIHEAIESIITQDYPHELMEVIFVDDGSKDETPSIIEKYAPKMSMKVKIIRKKWSGIGSSRNLVIKNAKGDYILWVDGDMVISSDFIRKLVEFMERHPNVGIAKGKQALKPGKDLLATLEAYSRAAGRMVNYQSKRGRLKSLGAGGSIYRIKVIKETGGFDENLRGYCEDWDLEIRVRKAGWALSTVDVYFLDYERCGLTWKQLWSRYWLRGYHTHYFLHKNSGMLKHYRIFPLAALIGGLLHAITLYKRTHQKAVFLLSIQSMFKMTAWYIGFIKSHLNCYAPKQDPACHEVI